MLNEILNNLKNFPNDECYQIKDKIYKNKDLYKYVCNIYDYILKNNTSKTPVIVKGHKQIYMLASFLACSMAGAAYVPIDECMPQERVKKIIEQVKPKIIIDETIKNIMNLEDTKNIEKIYLKDDDIYYIIFTSGTTGEPKGVQITYKNLKSCMNWLVKICRIENGVVLNQANFSFDLSVADLYLPLLTRSKHYILERETQKNYVELFKELNKSNANLMVATPSFVDLLLVDKSFNKNLMPNLAKILFCGESLNKNTVLKLEERFENLEIINCYGPTECTFAVTSNIVKKDEKISIGVPKEDVKIYIVGDMLKELKENEIGEILICGESVGKGYLKQELNKDVFIKYNNENAYLTGDLGYKASGKFYCVGRKDKQVKYKGYRIELSEIEAAFNNLEFIQKTVVIADFDENKKVRKIIAFIKLKEGIEKNIKEIKEKIENYLPNYMIPVIRIVNQIPLNSNGKVDEKKILEIIKL